MLDSNGCFRSGIDSNSRSICSIVCFYACAWNGILNGGNCIDHVICSTADYCRKRDYRSSCYCGTRSVNAYFCSRRYSGRSGFSCIGGRSYCSCSRSSSTRRSNYCAFCRSTCGFGCSCGDVSCFAADCSKWGIRSSGDCFAWSWATCLFSRSCSSRRCFSGAWRRFGCCGCRACLSWCGSAGNCGWSACFGSRSSNAWSWNDSGCDIFNRRRSGAPTCGCRSYNECCCIYGTSGIRNGIERYHAG